MLMFPSKMKDVLKRSNIVLQGIVVRKWIDVVGIPVVLLVKAVALWIKDLMLVVLQAGRVAQLAYVVLKGRAAAEIHAVVLV